MLLVVHERLRLRGVEVDQMRCKMLYGMVAVHVILSMVQTQMVQGEYTGLDVDFVAAVGRALSRCLGLARKWGMMLEGVYVEYCYVWVDLVVVQEEQLQVEAKSTEKDRLEMPKSSTLLMVHVRSFSAFARMADRMHWKQPVSADLVEEQLGAWTVSAEIWVQLHKDRMERRKKKARKVIVMKHRRRKREHKVKILHSANMWQSCQYCMHRMMKLYLLTEHRDRKVTVGIQMPLGRVEGFFSLHSPIL